MREGGREGLGGFICHHWMSRGARITNETEDSNEPPDADADGALQRAGTWRRWRGGEVLNGVQLHREGREKGELAWRRERMGGREKV